MPTFVISPFRGKYAIFTGSARLTSGHKTEAIAKQYLDDNKALLTYWAGSAGVSIQNTPAVTILC